MLVFQELDKKFILKDINLLKGGKVPPAEFNQVWRYVANVLDESENDRNEKVLKQIVVYLLQRIQEVKYEIVYLERCRKHLTFLIEKNGIQRGKNIGLPR